MVRDIIIMIFARHSYIIRGVPIIGSTDILATDMANFTTSVIGTTYS